MTKPDPWDRRIDRICSAAVVGVFLTFAAAIGLGVLVIYLITTVAT